MLRKHQFALALLLLSAAATAQPRLDTRREIRENPALVAGEYYMYETDLPAPSKPPKGYKAVYISHFGRHGARFAIGSDVYERMKALLDGAHAEGALTRRGEELFEAYTALYPEVAFRGGELTLQGQAQHRAIARKMYRDYPSVFKGKTRAGVISTNVHRVLLSMVSFLDELRQMDPDIRFNLDAGMQYMPVLDAMDKTNPGYIAPEPYSPEAKARQAEFYRRHIDLDGLTGRFFQDDKLLETYGRQRFINDLKNIFLALPCAGMDPDALGQPFSQEELYQLWRYRNLGLYMGFGRCPWTDDKQCLETAAYVKEIIDHADEDLAGGTCALRLRFAHDSGLQPLVSFMGINSFGAVVEDPEEVENYWRVFDIPMASNLQLVFYRHPRKPLLVSVLLNGKEATLPFDPADGPFYRWDDFKACYLPRIAEAEAFLEARR